MSILSPAHITLRFTALIMLLLLLGARPAAETRAALDEVSGTQIVVNTTNDEFNSNGKCSLREALRAADLDKAIDTCPAGSGLDTIIIPIGTYTLTIAGSNEDDGLTGDLDINSNLNILGNGMRDTIIDGNQLDRVFHITGEHTVEINGLSIQNGVAAVGEPFGYGGGGILNSDFGNLTLRNSILTANLADSSGGGLDSAGTATLLDVTFNGNSAESGGGVLNSGTIYLLGVTFTNNTATHSGGGFDNDNNATVTNVTFSGNTAPKGGGIHNEKELTLINTTLYGNSTAIDNASNVETVFKNTVVAGSTEGDNCTSEGTFISRGDYNLDSGASCNFDGDNDLSNEEDPKLGPLQDNQGPTWTHALLEGSRAIDGGDNSDCPTTDQRGASRPADGDGDDNKVCDIGAYEHKGSFPNLIFLPLTTR